MIINYESLELLNFPSHIIALIKACMALVSPSRGLHQGDPMSPLLFVIALKHHLSHMILDVVNAGTWTPLKFGMVGLQSHTLCSSMISFLLWRLSATVVQQILEILELFGLIMLWSICQHAQVFVFFSSHNTSPREAASLTRAVK